MQSKIFEFTLEQRAYEKNPDFTALFLYDSERSVQLLALDMQAFAKLQSFLSLHINAQKLTNAGPFSVLESSYNYTIHLKDKDDIQKAEAFYSVVRGSKSFSAEKMPLPRVILEEKTIGRFLFKRNLMIE